MIRTLNVILVVTSICRAGRRLCASNIRSGRRPARRRRSQRQIERQQADLSLLKADWAFLNQPANVAPIVTRHEAELNLQSLAQEQFGRFDTLPMRMKAPDIVALDSPVRIARCRRRSDPAAHHGGRVMAALTEAGAADRARWRAQDARATSPRPVFAGSSSCSSLIFGAVAGRLVQLGLVEQDNTIEGQTRDLITATRPAILDRNGLELAVDIRVPSLFAEPRRIIDVEEAAQAIHSVLPDINIDWLRAAPDRRQGLRLGQARADAGDPGADHAARHPRARFRHREQALLSGRHASPRTSLAPSISTTRASPASKRTWTTRASRCSSRSASPAATNWQPVNLSIDLRVQHVMHDVLTDALIRYKAIAAAGVMMDVQTGEIIGLVSLPDFDPNNPVTALEKDRVQPHHLRHLRARLDLQDRHDGRPRSTAARCRITDSFDARFGVRFGRFTIDDFHGKHRDPDGAGGLQVLVEHRHDQDHAAAGQGRFPRLPEQDRLRQAGAARTAGEAATDRAGQVLRDRRRDRELRPRPVDLAAAHGACHGGLRQRRQHGDADALSQRRSRKRSQDLPAGDLAQRPARRSAI